VQGLNTLAQNPDGSPRVDHFLVEWQNESYDPATGRQTLFVNLKSGLQWHDGMPLTAYDVEWTERATMTPAYEVPAYATNIDFYDTNNSVTAINATLIKFDLAKFNPFFADLLNFVLPKHVFAELTDNFTNINATALRNSNFNKPNGPNGPIGYGPYKFVSADTTNGVYQFQKAYNSTYASLMGIPEPAIANVTVVVIPPGTQAYTALKNGQVDWLDPNLQLDYLYQTMLTTDAALVTPVRYADPASAWQELGYNQVSPIWGQNAKDPGLWIPPNITKTTMQITTTSFMGPLVTTTLQVPLFEIDLRSILGNVAGLAVAVIGGLGAGVLLAFVVRRLNRGGGA
jgi:ABC-type transport system substrate-binding protein